MRLLSRYNLLGSILFLAARMSLAQQSAQETRENQPDTEQAQVTEQGYRDNVAPVRTRNWPDRSKIWPKHWYKDWMWWVGETALASLQAADAYSTAVGLSRCSGCVERSFLLGPHPSNGRIVGGSILIFGFRSALHVASWKFCDDPNRRSRSWRFTCDSAIPAIYAPFAAHAVVHNFGLKSPATSASTTASTKKAQFVGSGPSESISPVVSTGTARTLLLPKPFPGCGHSLALCTSFQPTAAPNIDLRSVHFH